MEQLPQERILLSQADVGRLEEDYVRDALRSGWVAPLGPHVDALEHEVAERVGVRHALALSSGTAALHLALLHLGAKPGTKVVVASMTFAATANAVVYTGAEPVFVDAREEDGNVDPDLMIDAVRTLRAEGETVTAAIPVDLFGRVADYMRLAPELADLGVPLVEDAAEAFGATHEGQAAGSFGRAAALSFNGNKIMTTSGGGMLLTDDTVLADHARKLSGQAREPVPWYEHTEIGYNYRLSNILAALGRAQLARLEEMIERRREIRQRYVAAFADLPVTFLGPQSHEGGDAADNCWLTTLTVDSEPGADAIVEAMSQQHIEARHLWKPMHTQPVFSGARSFVTGAAEHLFARGVALPSGSSLTDDHVARVIEAFRRCLT